MAIYHFQAKVIQRSEGRSAIAAAAYRAAGRLFDDRLGRTFDYSAKSGVIHSEILLPEGAPARWLDRALLWNEVEAAERRKDAQLAREIELSLPRELPPAEAIRLAQDFVRAQFVARGMVADLNVHWAIGPDGAAQPHAHVMLSLREIAGDGFGRKERAWNDRGALRGWREDWAAFANERLAEAGCDVRIDHRSNADQGIELEPQNKIGPAGARRALRDEDAERADEHQAIARRNGARILADPALALAALTRQQSTFTRRDLARFVSAHTADATQFDAVMAKVEASTEFVRVGKDGRGRDRFSTKEMITIERRMVASATALDARPAHPVALARRQAAPATAGLGEEQSLAFFHVTRARDLCVVCGIAGGGKSTLFGAARQAWEEEGYRVRGAALSGIAAEGLEQSTGIESRTLASLEYAWAQGKELLAASDILVVDEAGMLGSRQLGRLVETVRASGAKLVLSGDPQQLQAIEAGAALRAIAERVGVAEISEPRRQRVAWQKQATKELASGRTAAALARYEAASMVHEHATLDDAETALAATWAAERRDNPRQTRLMLTHTRVSARTLNDLARAARRAAGELGPDRVLATGQGLRAFAEGERIYFLKNDRGLGVKNGSLGTLERIEGTRLSVRLDSAAAGAARLVEFDLEAYGEINHGYAATIHKSQGATVDVAHVLATSGMDRHLAYVALSRHRSSVHLHWSAEEFGTSARLAERLGRERAKDTSLDYEQGAPVAAYAGRRGLSPLEPAAGTMAPGETPAAKAGDFQREERLRAIRSRLAADPGAARRNFEYRRIAAAIRPILPALARAVERQATAAADLGKAIVILGEKMRPRADAAADERSRIAGAAINAGKAAPRETPDAVAKADPDAGQERYFPPGLSLIDRAKLFSARLEAERLSKGQGGQRIVAEGRKRPPPLIPAIPASAGCDSFGRGAAAADVAARLDADKTVRGSRRELSWILGAVYRDPAAAAARLYALEKELGGARPTQIKLEEKNGAKLLGDLRGKKGWFASPDDKFDYEGARKYAGMIGACLADLRQAEQDVASTYRVTVGAQRRRDVIEIPALSDKAKAAIAQFRAAGCEAEVFSSKGRTTLSEIPTAARASAIWSRIEADTGLRGELERFAAAVDARFPEGCAPPDAPVVVTEAMAAGKIVRNAVKLHEVHLEREESERRFAAERPRPAPEDTPNLRPRRGPSPGL